MVSYTGVYNNLTREFIFLEMARHNQRGEVSYSNPASKYSGIQRMLLEGTYCMGKLRLVSDQVFSKKKFSLHSSCYILCMLFLL